MIPEPGILNKQTKLTRMDNNKYYIDLQRYFNEDLDEDSPTLVEINDICQIEPVSFCFPLGIEQVNVPPDILFNSNEMLRSLLRERIRHLFRIISESVDINELVTDSQYFCLPGALLAEWINRNQYVKRFVIFFGNNQFDNMRALCDALRQDTKIKTFGFDNSNQQEEDFILLGNALHENDGIENIEYYVNNTSLTVLTHALGPGSKINGLTIKRLDALFSESDIDITNQIEIILSENTSLTTLKIDYTIGFSGNVLPILRGVVNSNTITEFYFSSFDGINETMEYQLEQINMIAQMKQLKKFSIYLQNYKKVSATDITSALQGMHSLETLTIDAFQYDKNQLIKILQEISNSERQYALKLCRCILHIDIVPWLMSVHLESIQQCIVYYNVFNKINEEILNWSYLRELDIQFRTQINDAELEYKFATTICKSSTLEKISFRTVNDTNFFSEVTQKNVIDKLLERNERLTVCKDNPQKVSITEWPKLFSMADPTGLDFSYTCIRKIPNFFLTLLLQQQSEGTVEKENIGTTDKCIDCKRKGSPTEQHTIAKKTQHHSLK